MQPDDQVLEGTPADEQQQQLGQAVPENTAANGDTLDAIQDIEELRSKAKELATKVVEKESIIARHRNKPKEAPVQAALPAAETNLKRFATNQAKLLVPDEVKEVWDELTAIPLAGFDPLDPASIASNMKQRFKLYEKKDTKENPAAPLQTSTVVQGTAGQTVQQPKTIDPKLPKQPNQWY